MKKSITSVVFLLAGLFFVSMVAMNCSGKKAEQTEHQHDEGDSTDHHEMEMDSTQTAYACPMHPEVTGKEGDKCSKCGMKLEAVKEHNDDHEH